MSAPEPVALTRLFGEPTRFAEQHWGRAPLYVDDTTDLFDDILSIESLEAWLIASPRRPTVRMVIDGKNIEPHRYCKPTRLGPEVFADVVDIERVVECLNNGATLVAQSLHRVFAPVVAWAAQLQDDLSHRVQVNAYLTPPSATGLRPHADGHDVIAVQLHGTKQWDVAGVGKITMRPGNRLYLPRGTQHSASTDSGHSLHLTIGIHPVTYRQIVSQILRNDELLDRALPVGYQRSSASQKTRLVEDAIRTASTVLSHPAAAGHVNLESPPSTASVRRLQDSIAADDIDHTTKVALHDDVQLDRRGRDHIELRQRDTRLRLPTFTLGAVQQLLTSPLAVSSLCGLDPQAQLVLARRLLREGLATIVPH